MVASFFYKNGAKLRPVLPHLFLDKMGLSQKGIELALIIIEEVEREWMRQEELTS